MNKKTNERITITSTPFILGRGDDVDYTIDDALVRRKHSFIEFKGDQFYIYDAHTTNGTYVDDRRIYSSGLLLHNSARICMGDTVLVFYEYKADPVVSDQEMTSSTSRTVCSPGSKMRQRRDAVRHGFELKDMSDEKLQNFIIDEREVETGSLGDGEQRS